MKVLIAYDGSESADTAIDGLDAPDCRAKRTRLLFLLPKFGLPTPEHEASVKDTFPSDISGT